MDTDERMLTTKDNPYNPFTHWDEWLQFDRSHKYFTSEYLARVATTSIDLTDEENSKLIDLAMDEIIELNPLGIYKIVNKND